METRRPVVLLIGDSLLFHGGATAIREAMQAGGRDAEFIGTLRDEGGTLCEGRPSWETSDFTGAHRFVDADHPLEGGKHPVVPLAGAHPEAISVAEYLGLDAAVRVDGRWKHNPFLTSTSGGCAFDMRAYLDRLLLPDPSVVVFALGTNDVASHSASVAAAKYARGLRVLVDQTRAALPDAGIVVVLPAFGSWRLRRRARAAITSVFSEFSGELKVLLLRVVLQRADFAPKGPFRRDALHHSQRGSQKWAATVATAVAKYL